MFCVAVATTLRIPQRAEVPTVDKHTRDGILVCRNRFGHPFRDAPLEILVGPAVRRRLVRDRAHAGGRDVRRTRVGGGRGLGTFAGRRSGRRACLPLFDVQRVHRETMPQRSRIHAEKVVVVVGMRFFSVYAGVNSRPKVRSPIQHGVFGNGTLVSTNCGFLMLRVDVRLKLGLCDRQFANFAFVFGFAARDCQRLKHRRVRVPVVRRAFVLLSRGGFGRRLRRRRRRHRGGGLLRGFHSRIDRVADVGVADDVIVVVLRTLADTAQGSI